MGNTRRGRAVSIQATVHPHTHGEHAVGVVAGRPVIGSSPHAWGTPETNRIRRVPCRFIPTRMGNTPCPPSPLHLQPVHPHTHGEHVLLFFLLSPLLGSSPHAWGTLPLSASQPAIPRFIPTRMGNTRVAAPAPPPVTVHPHTHGEHSHHRRVTTNPYGSSPHAWGTRGQESVSVIQTRFIPTRMGNTYEQNC